MASTIVVRLYRDGHKKNIAVTRFSSRILRTIEFYTATAVARADITTVLGVGRGFMVLIPNLILKFANRHVRKFITKILFIDKIR
jgi:hypothetical protein